MVAALVIVPTYNEKANVRPLVEAVRRYFAEGDLLFVDDRSPDGTGEEIDRLCAEYDHVHVLHRQNKQGLGRAYLAGFAWALEREYRFVFEMDADFSHNPADLPRLREAAEQADLAVGSRYIGGIRVTNWPLRRLVLSRAAGTYVQWITGLPFTDPTSGFKCYRRELLQHLDFDSIHSNGYSFQIETVYEAWRRGFKVVEIPITFDERQSGQSKMSAHIVREALWIVWKLAARYRFRRRPGARHPASGS